MPSTYHLTNKEYTIMQSVWKEWDGKNPVCTRQFLRGTAEQGWTAHAAFTAIRRLEEKGYLRAERSPTSRRENVYYPLVTEEEWKYAQGQEFISNLHGSFKEFIINFVSYDKNSVNTLNELQSILDELKTKY